MHRPSIKIRCYASRWLVITLLALSAVSWNYLAVPQAVADNRNRVGPAVDLNPQDVVRLQLQAMANNDAAGPDTGIITAFQFASPANKLQTGPITKFLKIVRDPAYVAMIDNIGLEFGETVIENSTALVPVMVTASNGEDVGYLFRLSRQSLTECDGCWMTDSVAPMPARRPNDDKGKLL